MLRVFARLFKNLFAIRAGKLSDYFWAIVGPIMIITFPPVISDFFTEPIPKKLPETVEGIYNVISNPQDPLFYTVLIGACLTGPIIEELFFRGVFWRFCERISNKHYAFFATSIFFAFAHADPHHIVGVFPVGIFIGWLRLRSNSIFPAMLAHIVNNTFISLSILML